MSSDPVRAAPSGFGNPWLQFVISVLCTTVSQLCLKRGASEAAHFSEKWAWTGVTGLASPFVWLGILFVILSFVTWLYVLRHLPLSTVFPLSQVVHVLVPLGSWFILGEAISSIRWWGISFVLVGLAFVAKPAAKLEERL